jgi:hypothetical protein
MAILNPNIIRNDTLSSHGITSISNGNFTVQPIPTDKIQGQMLTASLKMTPYEAEQMDEHEMKTLLVSQMMREIMDANCIEFTKQQDFANDEVIIRARIFVTPKDDIQVIRKVLK